MELHPDKKDEKISDQEQLWNGDWGKLKRALTHEKSTVETGNAQYREVVSSQNYFRPAARHLGSECEKLHISYPTAHFTRNKAGTGAGETGALAPPAAALEPEEDVLSMATSAAEFAEYDPDEVPPDVDSHACSLPSTSNSIGASEDNSMGAIIRMAMARLQLDVPQAQPAPASAFFRRGPAPTSRASIGGVSEGVACMLELF
ncbi:unnamed protein product [Arctogadus glacialis]